MIGTVKRYEIDRGFGFIQIGDQSVFVHASAVKAAGLGELRQGQRVSFEKHFDQDGRPRAVDLRPL
jgi:CspA family cold shock protein